MRLGWLDLSKNKFLAKLRKEKVIFFKAMINKISIN